MYYIEPLTNLPTIEVDEIVNSIIIDLYDKYYILPSDKTYLDDKDKDLLTSLVIHYISLNSRCCTYETILSARRIYDHDNIDKIDIASLYNQIFTPSEIVSITIL